MDSEKQFIWECLCRGGCGLCRHLIHKRGVAICGHTGDFLEEKPVKSRSASGGLEEHPPAPVPSKNCAFNTDNGD